MDVDVDEEAGGWVWPSQVWGWRWRFDMHGPGLHCAPGPGWAAFFRPRRVGSEWMDGWMDGLRNGKEVR